MKLPEIRRRIDTVDRDLMGLLEERMQLALRARRHKTAIVDPRREREVLQTPQRLDLAVLEPEFAQQLLHSLIQESKRLQGQQRQLVAYQGESGAYSEVAAKRLAPRGSPLPCASFAEVFQAVEEGTFDLGIVPVENSSEGAVTEVNQLLVHTPLHIVGEVYVPVRHCLLVPTGAGGDPIQVVYSHPQALAQCRSYIRGLGLQPRPYYNTAGAARMVARRKPLATAAIASRLCADRYDLDVVRQGIEDYPANATRFVMLASQALQSTGDKCSILLDTSHRSGQLHDALRPLAQAGVNLTRIASMPVRSQPGRYRFLLDLEGCDRDEAVAAALASMRTDGHSLRVLGCYPSHRSDRVGEEDAP